MNKLTADERQEVLQLFGSDPTFTMTIDSIQARSLIAKLEDWIEQEHPMILHRLIRETDEALTLDGANRLFAAWMRVKGAGVQHRNIPGDYYDYHHEAIEALYTSDDRSAAIVGGALLDAKLTSALKSILIPELSNEQIDRIVGGPSSVLGTVSSRIAIAHALGIIGPASHYDMNAINWVRNKFAHKLQIKSFDCEEIANKCRTLKMVYCNHQDEMPITDPKTRYIRSLDVVVGMMFTELSIGTPLGHKPSKSP